VPAATLSGQLTDSQADIWPRSRRFNLVLSAKPHVSRRPASQSDPKGHLLSFDTELL